MKERGTAAPPAAQQKPVLRGPVARKGAEDPDGGPRASSDPDTTVPDVTVQGPAGGSRDGGEK